MTDGSDWFGGCREVTDDLEHALVEPQVLRRPAAGDDQGVEGGLVEVGKIRVDCKSVSWFFRVGLVPLKVMDGRRDTVTRSFVGTHRGDVVTEHQQHLQGHHCLVVFDEVAHEHQNFFTQTSHLDSVDFPGEHRRCFEFTRLLAVVGELISDKIGGVSNDELY